ncbi:rRNA small subunit pseudouridine methyltransferase Nep1 [Nematocida ausubeli]|uniref:Uncharacterized protein n=1 Tax=Nematocida ausubeli (strain ATCC PRA-371 / ERTm2) TaxID=1913371 RepID=H8ZCL6_NEMA1|nr:hypothetical protein NERG_01459 [Nematocida ausubeli]KAI5133072.1 rRNA small subunit pseudouridine methyltransferase Nep1 [Nematocida ausubeli]KAI5147305.1 rRNA small subunit pseudouridine methyltransferase Nep1 [Nematocida ausubeli]KAI5161474.1 rRNA small subunit pseudouridine methyltransferase Nep1 [Nematocida ausubeli]KAI5161500.1 rRNA small subunit pseudouridine methyltransferase Nep1 [Nematocida ausubeli]
MLTVVLQNANIEIVKTKRGKELLSSEMVEARKRANSTEYRPDILHQCLLMLLDSPLNKAGHLRVLIELSTGKVVTLNKTIRIPRVYSRFSGLLVQLLERHRIYSEGERIELMKVEKERLESFISNESIKVGLSKEGENFFDTLNCDIKAHAEKQNKEHAHSIEVRSEISEQKEIPEYVFYINAISSGEDPNTGMHHILSLSAYALSAATCCSKICTYFEETLNVF